MGKRLQYGYLLLIAIVAASAYAAGYASGRDSREATIDRLAMEKRNLHLELSAALNR